MPETTVHEDREPSADECNVRSAGNLPVVAAVTAVAAPPERVPQQKFGARVPAPDARHHAAAGLRIDDVRHDVLRRGQPPRPGPCSGFPRCPFHRASRAPSWSTLLEPFGGMSDFTLAPSVETSGTPWPLARRCRRSVRRCSGTCPGSQRRAGQFVLVAVPCPLRRPPQARQRVPADTR